MATAEIGFTCGPDASLGEYPCMNSIPDKAIIAVIAVVMYYLAASRSSTGDADDIANCDPCWHKLNQHEKLVALANMLLSFAVENGYMTAAQGEGATAVSCLLNVPEDQLFSIILCYLCTFLDGIELAPT